MGGVIVPIMVMDLVRAYVANPAIKDQLPEFDFIWAIGQMVKDRGCYCGISQKTTNVNLQFNEIVENLSPELLTKIRAALNRESLCFGILDNHRFDTKCY